MPLAGVLSLENPLAIGRKLLLGQAGTHVYLHVPFCASKCVYCDFYVVLQKYGGHETFTQAVLKEIDLQFLAWQGQLPPIATFYVGGGTPSLLSAQAYEAIFERLRRYVTFSPTVEITLEANPLDWASPPEAYLQAGFNRVSVGLQSLNDNELKLLSRRHSAQAAIETVKTLQQGGFNNISVDLMHGLPEQTQASWQATLEAVIALNVQHVSMYGLQVEENTPLERLLAHPKAKTRYPLPLEEQLIPLYWQGIETLQQAGFTAYEISNLAQSGFQSAHNTAYWQNKLWFGLGPSATGYLHPYRTKNPSSLSQYIQAPGKNAELETVSALEWLENALIFGLRQREGVCLQALANEPCIKQAGLNVRALIEKPLQTHLKQSHLLLEGHQLRLNPAMVPFSNSILSDFCGLLPSD